MLHPACVVAAAALILSAILAQRTARKIVEPLEKLDLEHPLENDTYEELSPLLRRIHQQHEEIGAQLRSLRQKTDEFNQITANMSEGLVLLDGSAAVLSINPAAEKLFGTENSCVGSPFCQVDRKPEMTGAVETAFREGNCELRAQRNGREYQFLLNRIVSGADVIGLMILCLLYTSDAADEG